MSTIETEGKACSGCARRLPLDRFAKNPTTRDGLRSDCRDCTAARARGYLLQRRFGISVEGYEARLAAQGHGCAICGSGQPGGRWPSFHVDHCHETGRVRGLLCYPCNYALGMLGDTPEALLRAYLYVRGEL